MCVWEIILPSLKYKIRVYYFLVCGLGEQCVKLRVLYVMRDVKNMTAITEAATTGISASHSI